MIKYIHETRMKKKLNKYLCCRNFQWLYVNIPPLEEGENNTYSFIIYLFILTEFTLYGIKVFTV